ncbi:replication initiation protein RepC [Yoonia sp. GPGPB17]|uniref:replication initiation protein RepC n=1 Tax=Yoonia sp. GPGPB17 TaxID=3026147 RepID=UPI004040CA91
MQELVQLAQRGRSTLADHDFEEAAYERLYQIGISKSIWDEACKSMGSPAATTCVIITDANMNRPNNPVRSPGAYMRTLIKQHKDGKLNIIASLIAISERTRN